MNFRDILWMFKQFTEALKWTVARWANINQSRLAETVSSLYPSAPGRSLALDSRTPDETRSWHLLYFSHFPIPTLYVTWVFFWKLNILCNESCISYSEYSAGYYSLHLKQLKIGKWMKWKVKVAYSQRWSARWCPCISFQMI